MPLESRKKHPTARMIQHVDLTEGQAAGALLDMQFVCLQVFGGFLVSRSDNRAGLVIYAEYEPASLLPAKVGFIRQRRNIFA